jgi:hydroxyacylglutathione hydrolase
MIQIFPSGPFSTNAYVVSCSQTQEAAVLDPAPESAEHIQNYLNKHQLKLRKILLTHSHWDHIADVKTLKDHFQVPVYVHLLDAPNLQSPGADGLPLWIAIPPVQPDHYLEEGMLISIGDLSFKVIHTPGHSPGCVCFYEAKQHLLFSGDTLFKGAIGNLSFPTSQPELMDSSLAKLAQLPSQTRVFPGHGPSTTIQEEFA